ncbi:MAG: hypothetical protein EBS38_03845 [Actinobacteria bacterium]|nr:hypothetical protein [Actinomycetota bacterium]
MSISPDLNGDLQTASVDPMPLSAYCPGALAEVGGEQGTDLGSIDRVGKATFNLWGVEAEPLENGGLFAQVKSKDQSTKLLSANQTQAVSRPRLAGLAATYCPMPAAQGYFLAGDSGPGSESVLHLANPNDVDLVVDLELQLAEEVVQDRVPLAAGEHKLISLVSLSGAESSYAVRYQTSGLPVAAFMQLREVSGLNATGVALVPPTKPLVAGSLVGLVVAENAFVAPRLRVFNPGLESVDLNLQAINGEEFELVQIKVPAGTLVEKDLKLPAGASLISFEASAEVALSVRNDVITTKLDFEWLIPTEVFDRALFLRSPGNTQLVLANPSLTPIDVVVSSGTSQQLRLEPRSQQIIAVSRGELSISGSGFLASLHILSGAGYAVIQPLEMQNLGESIEVLVR